MLAIFKSRKSVLALIAIVVYLFDKFAPQLGDKPEQFGMLAWIIAAAILGITLEDGVKWWSLRPRDADDLLDDLDGDEKEATAEDDPSLPF